MAILAIWLYLPMYLAFSLRPSLYLRLIWLFEASYRFRVMTENLHFLNVTALVLDKISFGPSVFWLCIVHTLCRLCCQQLLLHEKKIFWFLWRRILLYFVALLNLTVIRSLSEHRLWFCYQGTRVALAFAECRSLWAYTRQLVWREGIIGFILLTSSNLAVVWYSLYSRQQVYWMLLICLSHLRFLQLKQLWLRIKILKQ